MQYPAPVENTDLRLDQKKILIVEDDPTLFKLWNRLLRELGCKNFIVVSSPHEAIKCLERAGADILLTDLRLPEIDGLQLIRLACRINPKMKTIVTSACIAGYDFPETDNFIHIIKKPYRNLDNIRQLMILFINNAPEIGIVERIRDKMYIWDL